MDSGKVAASPASGTGSGELWLFLLPLLHGGLTSPVLPWLVAAFLAAALVAAIGRWISPGGAAWGSLDKPSTIPGPRGLPFIGSLLDMGGGLAHRRLAEMASRGRRRCLMALSLGSTRLVIASQPEAARELLNSAAFADRPLKQSAQQLLFGRAIGFAPYGDYWRGLRRLAANHLFSPRRIAAHERFRQAEASVMLGSIAAAASACSAPVELRPFLQQASINNILRAVFGRRYDFASSEGAELKAMIREGFELLGAFNWADHIPALRAIDPQAIHDRCAELVPKVRSFVQTIINEHRSRATGTSPSAGSDDESDFVDVLLAFKGDEALSDEDAIAVLWEMIFRGTDTTAILTEWILAELVLHPQIQDSLRAELAAAGDLTDATVARLPLLTAVVKETLRLHPPGPLLSWARLAIHDTTVAGHCVPAGTTAMVNMWAITHDESVWSHPNEFRPERFMAGGEAGPDFDVKGTDLRLAPFGAGRRVCPGRALGLATVNLWVARIVHRFKLLPDPACPVDLSEVLKLSCEMIKPLRVLAVERDE